METGYYKNVKKIVHIDEVKGQEEQGHWEVVAEYPETGGKDVKWVVDVEGIPAVPAHDEERWEQEWVEYTPKEIAEQEIAELKAWFDEYDNQIKQYERDVRLGAVGTYHIGEQEYTIQQLDELATEKASQISAIRNQIA